MHMYSYVYIFVQWNIWNLNYCFLSVNLQDTFRKHGLSHLRLLESTSNYLCAIDYVKILNKDYLISDDHYWFNYFILIKELPSFSRLHVYLSFCILQIWTTLWWTYKNKKVLPTINLYGSWFFKYFIHVPNICRKVSSSDFIKKTVYKLF